jgi:hypothetical protein
MDSKFFVSAIAASVLLALLVLGGPSPFIKAATGVVSVLDANSIGSH